ncbi:MAG: hypothetical protein JWP97_121 [Labilithrix sp.]|nr:hypothetical protein [Labilithrix sp.]
MRLLTTLLIAMLVGCAGRPAASPPRPAPPRTASRGEAPAAKAHTSARHATLRYQLQNGRSFPLPLVSGTVAGHPVLMLVDTGANSHVIAGWLARKLGLPMKKLGDLGTDHVGKSIATFRVERPELAIDEWGPLATGPVLATEVPEIIEKLGIGVFISPQRLVEEGDSVVLDLQKGELRSAVWSEAHYELSATGLPLVMPEQGRACEDTESPIKGLAFVVPATVEGQRVELLVDTGAEHSDVFTSSPSGQKLAGQSTVVREPMYTASGKITARRLKAAHVVAGGVTLVGDVDLIGGAADGSCPRDGVLAMDVLRACALLLGRDQLYARCLPPARPADPAPR